MFQGGSPVKEDEAESFTPVAGSGPLCDRDLSNDIDTDDVVESLRLTMGIQLRLP